MHHSDIDKEIFNKRLTEVVKEHSDFAKKTGLSTDRIEEMKEDLSKVYTDDLLAISGAYGVSLDWLLGLTKEKYISKGETLADDLRRAEERAEREGWIDADVFDKEMEITN